MRDRVDPSYAPYELVLDAAQLGLVETTVTSELGSCTARHRPTRTGVRATVFLHGASGAWTTWTPLLAAASAGRVDLPEPVLLDLPGWGDARLTDHLGDITVQAICSLVKAVLDELGYTEWDLVGHSLGGFVALHMASIWSTPVTSVRMISGTTFSVIRSVDHPARNFAEVPGFTMLWRVMQFLTTLGPVGPWLVRTLGATAVLRLVFGPLFRHGRRIPLSLVRATARDLRPRSFALAVQVAHNYDASTSWRSIRCPVFAVKGDRDVFVTERDFIELASVLPDSHRTVIADCGHFGIVERPSEVLAALGFLPATGLRGEAR